MRTNVKKILLLAAALFAAAANASTTFPVQLLNPAGSTSGQVIVSTGPTSAPVWGGIGVSGIQAIAANTVLANATASSAPPTAFAMPSCSSSTSALQWTSGTGFVCGTVASAGANSNITSLTGITTPLATSAGGLGVNNSSANGVPVFSSGTASVTTTPNLGTPSAVTLTNGTGLPVTGLTGLGTGVSSALGTAVTGTGGIVLAGGATLTGTPTAPTASTGTSTTQLATTAFVANTFASPPTAGYGSSTPEPVAATTISATGLISPMSTVGIKGTTTNDSAPAGSWGELGNGNTTLVSMTNNTAANCTSKSLTAGQWLVWGVVLFQPTAAPGQIVAGISQTSATLGATGTYQSLATSFTSANNQELMAPPQPLQLASTTTVYLIGQMQFSSGTATCSGYINAYRMR